MEPSLFLPLLMLVLVCMPQGFAGDSQENRLSQKVEKICDDFEDANKILSESRKSLERHATALRVLAEEIDKVHEKFTDDMIINSGVVVGGDLIHAGGVAWEYFKDGSPVASFVGMGLSLLGRYMQESTSSGEQERTRKITDIADQIFRGCEETLQEVSYIYQEMQWKWRYLEEQEKESVPGTIPHKKMTEILLAFSHFQPPRIKKQFINNKNGLFNFLLNVGIKSGAIEEFLEKVVPGLAKSKSVAISKKGASVAISKKGTSAAISKKGTSEVISKKGTSAVNQVSKMSKYLYFFEAVSAATDLYRDGGELVKGVVHRNAGAHSELAESIRTMAANLEAVTHSLAFVLPKGKRG